MKSSTWKLFALIAVITAGVAYAAAYGGALAGLDTLPRYLKGGMFVGTGAPTDTANKVAAMKRCTLVYDFPSIPATGANSGCQDSPSATCTGVVFGDQLALGIDQVPPNPNNGAPPLAFVQAADAVKVRVCNDSTDAGAVDWPDASYTILWIH